MSKLDPQNIEVLNYNRFEVFVRVNKDDYVFNASRDGITPAYIPLTLNEIKAISNNSNIFQIGLLTFEDELKEEIFTELRVTNWQDILTDEQIKDILLNPSIEGLERILAIENVAMFDRVRTALFTLTQGDKDVSTKVREIVDARGKELQRNIRHSKIVLPSKPIKPESIDSKELNEVKEQNALLQQQLDEMKAMMKQMMASQTAEPKPKKKATKAEAEA